MLQKQIGVGGGGMWIWEFFQFLLKEPSLGYARFAELHFMEASTPTRYKTSQIHLIEHPPPIPPFVSDLDWSQKWWFLFNNTTHECILTTRKRSLGQGNVFTPVCQSFCSQGGVHPEADTHLTDPPTALFTKLPASRFLVVPWFDWYYSIIPPFRPWSREWEWSQGVIFGNGW